MGGELLRKRREEKGLELRGVADSLRIRHEYLSALEEENFAKLPPAVYTKGYIRDYALFLGIDPAPLVEFYYPAGEGSVSQVKQGQQERAVSCRSLRRPLAKVSAGALVFLALFLVVKSQFTVSDRRTDMLLPPPVPPAENQEKMAEPALPAPETTNDRRLTDEQETASAFQNGRYRVKVTATDTTWLRVEEEGKTEEALLRPGESKEWSSDKPLGLKIGNAGGVQITVNGKDLGFPGKKGEVVRLMLPGTENRQTGMN